jgi:putative transposase
VIKTLATQFPVRTLCDVLEVTRSGYYQWHKPPPSRRQQANQQLLRQIREAFDQSRQTYGSPRITHQLRRQHIVCGHNRVARLMRLNRLCAKSKRPFRPRTTNSRHQYGTAPNRLKLQGPPTAPNQAWVADITYIRTQVGWVYLAAVMDLFSRKILGWSLAYSLQSSLVQEALQRALALRRPAPGLLHHSDRGLQYASGPFQALLHNAQILPSMSNSGNCYDNATMESFWSTIKTELISHHSFTDLLQAHASIAEYIHDFYNPKRLHSALGFKSPVEFEQHSTYN